jgi:uncharacterized membrane protein (DUF485 family)
MMRGLYSFGTFHQNNNRNNKCNQLKAFNTFNTMKTTQFFTLTVILILINAIFTKHLRTRLYPTRFTKGLPKHAPVAVLI